MKPDFAYERQLWDKGLKLVAGMDEVGRGCFAGPVVAAAVIFSPMSRPHLDINDSKKVKPLIRIELDKWIRKNTSAWGIGSASVAEINKLGLGNATNVAFRRAIASCKTSIDYLLMDAFFVPHLKGVSKSNQLPIIKGDGKSLSIAAASIIAKVYRDKMLVHLSESPEFSVYKWDKNKGYGTKEHREAILVHGKSRHHRNAFVDTWLKKRG